MKTETDIYDNLKPVTFNDFDIIYSFLKKYPSENCDFNICNIFTWGLHFKLEYTIYSGRLIFFNPSYSCLLAPVGEILSAEELFQINNCFKKTNTNLEILAVSEDYINNNPNLKNYFDIKNDETCSDYIYLTENLANLTGKKLAKKKNLISQFNKLYKEYTVKSVDANDYEEIMDFCYYWKKAQKVENDHLDMEFEAIKTILTRWDLFPCDGFKLYIDGKISAFSIYSSQTPDMATVHFEKFDPAIKGAGQVINHETAKALINKFKYINREDDMGSPGIRQAKRSYQPIRMLPYYILKGIG